MTLVQASRVRSYIPHQGSGVSSPYARPFSISFESVFFVRILKRSVFTFMFQIFPNNLLYTRYISDRFKPFFYQSIAKEPQLTFNQNIAFLNPKKNSVNMILFNKGCF